MKFITKFDLGELVILRHDKDQSERMVVQITVAGTGVRYNLMFGTTDTWHYEEELIPARDRKEIIGFRPIKIKYR